jgi:hypothetical protein
MQHGPFLSLTSERTRRAISVSLRDFWLEVILSFLATRTLLTARESPRRVVRDRYPTPGDDEKIHPV